MNNRQVSINSFAKNYRWYVSIFSIKILLPMSAGKQTTRHPVSTWLLSHNTLFAILWPTKEIYLTAPALSVPYGMDEDFSGLSEKVYNFSLD